MTEEPVPGTKDPFVMRECVKAYLHEVRLRELEYLDLEHRIKEVKERLDGLSSSSGSPEGLGCASGDRIASGLGMLDDLQREWAEAVNANMRFVKDAYEICRPRHVERYACWLHWVKGLSWTKVAKRIGYSTDHTKRGICDKGVAELYPLIPEEYRRYTFPNAEI